MDIYISMYVSRSRNNGRLPGKTSSIYHLTSLVDVNMSGNSWLKITYFCKPIVLFDYPLFSWWNWWRLIFCVESYNSLNYDNFLDFKTKLFACRMHKHLHGIYPKFQYFRWPVWNFHRYKYFYNDVQLISIGLFVWNVHCLRIAHQILQLSLRQLNQLFCMWSCLYSE